MTVVVKLRVSTDFNQSLFCYLLLLYGNKAVAPLFLRYNPINPCTNSFTRKSSPPKSTFNKISLIKNPLQKLFWYRVPEMSVIIKAAQLAKEKVPILREKIKKMDLNVMTVEEIREQNEIGKRIAKGKNAPRIISGNS